MCLGHGEFVGVPTDETIYLNGTPIKGANGSVNFTGVRWEFRSGTQTQEPINAFPAVETETAINAECKYNAPVTRALSNLQLTACRVRLGFPRMTFTNDQGDTGGTKVTYKIELSTDGGTWSTVVDGICEGKTTTLYQRQHRIELPKATRTGWQIRVTRTTPDSTSQMRVDAFNFEVLTEVIDVKLRYPGLALLYLEFDAKQFPNGIPKVSVKIKGQKCWIPNNYDPVTRTYSGVWGGVLVRAWTDNPAWHAYETLVNSDWGLGSRVPAALAEKSKWELYRIAQFADQQVPDGSGTAGKTEPRMLSNIYMQAQNSAFNVLRDIVAIFNGNTCWAGDRVLFSADMPRDAKRVVNNTNVANGRFEYSFGDQKQRHSSAIVQYDDPQNHYTTQPAPVQVPGLVSRYGVNPVTMTAIGCTRASEAQRRGYFALYTNMDDMICNFNVGRDGLVYRAGDVIKVADTFLSGRRDAGGRVVSVSIDGNGVLIILDRVPMGDVSNNTVIYFNDTDGVMQPYYLGAIGDAGRIRLRKHPNGPAVAVGNFPEQATWVVEVPNLKAQLFSVLGVSFNDDGTYSVASVKYNPSKQAAIDTGARLDQLPVTEIPPGWLGIPQNVKIAIEERVVQGQRVQGMRISYDAVPGAESYVIQWRKDSGDWANAGTTATLGLDVPAVYTGTYVARVRAVNSWGVSSVWATSPPVQFTGRTGEPEKLASITTTPLIGGVRVSWGFGVDTSADTAYTELQFRPVGSSEVNPLFNVPYPSTAFDHLGLAPAVYFQYRGRIVDKSGFTSAWSDWVDGNSATDIGEYIDTIENDFLASPEGERLMEKLDFTGNAILENALANHADVQRRLVAEGNNQAQILEVRTVITNQQETTASLEQQVSAQRDIIDTQGQAIGQVGAAVNQRMLATVSYNGNASAMYSVNAGVIYKGSYYDAGMVLGVTVNNGVAKSRIGFKADQFIITNPNGGNVTTPFVIDGNNTYIDSAYIKNGTINSAKIVDELRSANYHWEPDQSKLIGWAINSQTGNAVFAQVTVRGNVMADAGYFSAELRAGSGYMDNITIGANCNILGKLSVTNIEGVVTTGCPVEFTGYGNSARYIKFSGNPLIPMRIYGTVFIKKAGGYGGMRFNNTGGDYLPETIFYGGDNNSTRNRIYTVNFDVVMQPNQTCYWQLHAGAGQSNEQTTFTGFATAVPVSGMLVQQTNP